MLQIFSIKTLVKSYLPHKDAHLRPGIEKLLEILKNILAFGEVSKDIKSKYRSKPPFFSFSIGLSFFHEVG